MTTVPFWVPDSGTVDSRVDVGGVGDTEGGSGLGGSTDCNSDNRSSTEWIHQSIHY